MNSAKKLAKIALSYEGAKKYSDKHKKLVDTFNTVKPNGEIAKYDYDWCAIAYTAWNILDGMTMKEVPMGYNCGELVEQAKKLGIWVENDAHVPHIGAGIIYNWDDTTGSKGDCKSGASHVGVVYKTDDNYIYIVEGNMSTTSKVGKRKIAINGSFIRGFIEPRYRAHDISYMARRMAWYKNIDGERVSKSVYSYPNGKPRKNFSDVMKKVYPKYKNFSGCHTFVGVVLKQCEFKTMPHSWKEIFKYLRQRFTEINYHCKSSELKDGDIMIYKNAEGGYHIWIITIINGKKVIAEANQNRYYGHINTSLKKALEKHNGIWVFRCNY